MLGSRALIAFVAVAQHERAREFYRGTLGLALRSEDDFAFVFEVNGTMLRIQKLPTHTPAAFTVLGFVSEDIEADVKQLLQRNVQCERYPYFEQDELGIWAAPGGAKVAWFKDPDGNTLSLTQFEVGER